jgi:hypothetical protein
MSWIAVAIGGSALIGGLTSSMSANKQSKSADKASQIQMDMFNRTQTNLQPWMQSGQAALGQLNAGTAPGGQFMQPFSLDKFHESPGYQFNLQQGQQALDKASAARGNFYAPQTLQDTAKFSQGLASNEFNNAYNMYNQDQGNIFNRLFAMSGSGQNAAANIGGFGTNAANNVASNTIGSGNAQGAGIMGIGNAANTAIGQGYNAYLLNQILGSQQMGSYGGGLNSIGGSPSTGVPSNFGGGLGFDPYA